ncbi:MAG: hypothetical protein WC213_06625, partial [Arenimonas sp.]
MLKDGDNSWFVPVYQARAAKSEQTRKADDAGSSTARSEAKPQPALQMAARVSAWLARQRVAALYHFMHLTVLARRAIGSLRDRGPASTFRIIAKRLFPVKR